MEWNISLSGAGAAIGRTPVLEWGFWAVSGSFTPTLSFLRCRKMNIRPICARLIGQYLIGRSLQVKAVDQLCTPTSSKGQKMAYVENAESSELSRIMLLFDGGTLQESEPNKQTEGLTG